MATAVTKKDKADEIWELYRATISLPDRGPVRGEKCRLDGGATRKFRRLVREAKVDQKWVKYRRLSSAAYSLSLDHDVMCEHCLNTNRAVHLMFPAIVSRHKRGDWVCADCDELAAAKIAMVELGRLATSDAE